MCIYRQITTDTLPNKKDADCVFVLALDQIRYLKQCVLHDVKKLSASMCGKNCRYRSFILIILTDFYNHECGCTGSDEEGSNPVSLGTMIRQSVYLTPEPQAHSMEWRAQPTVQSSTPQARRNVANMAVLTPIATIPASSNSIQASSSSNLQNVSDVPSFETVRTLIDAENELFIVECRKHNIQDTVISTVHNQAYPNVKKSAQAVETVIKRLRKNPLIKDYLPAAADRRRHPRKHRFANTASAVLAANTILVRIRGGAEVDGSPSAHQRKRRRRLSDVVESVEEPLEMPGAAPLEDFTTPERPRGGESSTVEASNRNTGLSDNRRSQPATSASLPPAASDCAMATSDSGSSDIPSVRVVPVRSSSTRQTMDGAEPVMSEKKKGKQPAPVYIEDCFTDDEGI